jgi:hypothetical protein
MEREVSDHVVFLLPSPLSTLAREAKVITTDMPPHMP